MTIASPVDSSPLRLLEPPTRLRVPLGVRSPMGAPPEISIGAKVAKGEVLAEISADGAPAALAPTSGRIIGLGQAALTNGHTVPVVELECDFEDRQLPEEHEVQREQADSL